MNKTQINEKNAMTVYKEIFDDILKLRSQRARIYGDAWVKDPIEAKTWLIWEKAQRAVHITKNNPELKNDYEKLEDTLMDMVNYCMFSLVIMRKIRGEKK